MGRKRWIGTSNDVTVTTGTVLQDLMLGRADGQLSLKAGQKVDIARIIRTPVGLSFRIKNANIWLHEDQVGVELQPDQIYDYTGTHPDELVPQSWKSKAKTKKRNNSQNHIQKRCKNRIRSVINTNEPNKRVLIGDISMDKQELKSVLRDLTPGEEVTIAFRGDRADESGTFTVIRTKVGRGKGGSQLVELKTPTGDVLTTGTPESDAILHVRTADGVLHGFETEAEVPPVFETNAERASQLKETFQGLLDADGQYTVDIESTHAPLNGTFTVVNAVQKRGLYGQVVLTLQAPGAEPFDVWSFRHSGVITSFTVRS